MPKFPAMDQKPNSANSTHLQAQEPSSAIQDWRDQVLNIFLPIAALTILPAVIQTVVQVFTNPKVTWQGAAIFVLFYLILVYTTVRRDLNASSRSWVVIVLTYLTGTLAMARGGLAGDGRLYLVALPVLATILINQWIGIYAAGISIITYTSFGYLAHTGALSQWLITQDNPLDAGNWLYNGFTLITLVIVTVFVVVKFSDFQVQTLNSVQKFAQALADAYHQLELANQQLEEKVQQRTTELSNANQHLQFLATHDNLTGLPNRILFFDRLEQAIKKSRRQKHRFALFFIDLDDFKRINDSFGHIVGDQVLQAVSNSLSYSVRDSDTVARLAGDEFAFILEDVQSLSNVEAIAQKTLKAVSQPINVPHATIVMSVSIGISLFPDHGKAAETLLRKADAAMYLVKNGDQNGYRMHTE
jgi:diguanylate cyclase (GGDEF)-like protein